ncbi:hypothetical protein Leryth_008305 [Lithospermum erythrorhizon]|nr:hypothetical protein Leryth_008305 [Lithospermum erythrorhizon]
MEKELIQLFEAVQKAAEATGAEGGPEEDRCLDALNQLKQFPVNYQVLVSSQVGKRVRGLTKHSSTKIKVLAGEVVEIWKEIIVKETLKNKKNGEVKSEGSAKAEKMKSVKAEGVATVKTEREIPTSANLNGKLPSSEMKKKIKTDTDVIKTERSPSVQIKAEKIIKEEKSSSRTLEHIKVERTMKKEENSSPTVVTKPKKDSVGTPKLSSIVYCKDKLRDKMREILAEGLLKVASEVADDLKDEVNSCDPYRVAVMVESAMFEKWGTSTGAQKAKYRSIMFNIKDSKNPDFRRKVLLGQFEPHTITELTPDQMASDALREKNEKIKEKALFECERGQAAVASTDKFKCGRCKKNETTYYQMQTRSADEPMTTYVTCVNYIEQKIMSFGLSLLFLPQSSLRSGGSTFSRHSLPPLAHSPRPKLHKRKTTSQRFLAPFLVDRHTCNRTCCSKVKVEDDITDESCELVNGVEISIGEGEDSTRAFLFSAVKNNNGTGILLLSDIFGFEDSATRDFA